MAVRYEKPHISPRSAKLSSRIPFVFRSSNLSGSRYSPTFSFDWGRLEGEGGRGDIGTLGIYRL